MTHKRLKEFWLSYIYSDLEDGLELNQLVLDMMVEPLLPLPYYQQALESVDGEQIQPYMEPIVAIHLSGRNMA